MINLKTFLKQQHTTIDDFDLEAKIKKWLASIKPSFDIYKRFIVDPLAKNPKYAALTNNYQQWFAEDKFTSVLQTEIERYFSSFYELTYSRDELVENIQTLVDLHFKRLFQHAKWVAAVVPLRPSINPFEKKVSGVEMRVYLKTNKDSAAQEIGEIAVSEVGHTCTHQRLSTSGMFNPFHQAVTKVAHTHAEYKWFQKSLVELMEKLKPFKYLGLQKNQEVMLEHDAQMFYHLDDYPRLEFVLSSSNCHDCRPLFPKLRELLKTNDFDIPILIFASKPFNTAEISQSSLCLVNYQGHFIDTGVRIDMDYDNNCSRVGNQNQFKLDKIKAIEADLVFERALVRQCFMITDNPNKQLLASLIHMVCEKPNPNHHDLYWLESWIGFLPQTFYPDFAKENQMLKDYIHEQLKKEAKPSRKRKQENIEESCELIQLSKDSKKLGMYCQPCHVQLDVTALTQLRQTWMRQTADFDGLTFVILYLMFLHYKIDLGLDKLKNTLNL
jgi:thiol-disulfide isomerase/thioredoxin